MKRLQILLVPLFALPLLTGCKIGNLDDQHSLSFTCQHCYVMIKGKRETDIAFFVDKNKKVEYPFEFDEGYTLSKETIEIKNTETGEYFTDFEYANDKLTITMTADFTVKATASGSGPSN